MKGVVFIALSSMIQQLYGHRVWNEFLDESGVESQGIYTSTEIYDDKESQLLLDTISRKLGKEQGEILHAFGTYLIKYFYRLYPQLFDHVNFLSFMRSIDSNVHPEIEKISPRLIPPVVQVVSSNENGFSIKYSSKRKLCHLAHGLIAGAAKIYKEDVVIRHISCMREGRDCCMFEVLYRRKQEGMNGDK
nr:heme NO-binding domain-containing protein [Bacteriovorax sp. HI3]